MLSVLFTLLLSLCCEDGLGGADFDTSYLVAVTEFFLREVRGTVSAGFEKTISAGEIKLKNVSLTRRTYS